MKPRIATALTAFLLAGAAVAQDALPAVVQAALARAGVPPKALAAIALPLDHRAPVWRHRSEVPMQPGSAMKLVTAVVALDRLGITHTARTRLLSAAPLVNGVLQGDLVLAGGGDPDFGLGELWKMLVELRDSGVNTVAGNLVLDRTRYRPARPDIGEPAIDNYPERWWNVTPDALVFDGGLQPVELDAKSAAHSAAHSATFSARLKPQLAGVRIDASALTLNDRACANWDEDWLTPRVSDDAQGVVIALQGAFPRGCSRVEEMQLVDRTRYIGLWVAQIWRELGGRWAGGTREGAAPEAARVLVNRRSRPLGEALRPIIKTSDNTLTRLLFLELGVAGMAAAPEARTLDLARSAVQRWFVERGIPAGGLVMDNGSGLSRSERISVHTMARLIEWAWRSPLAPDLLMSLPVAGVDGTLRNRIKDSPATGRARLKTGTLANVAALAGVVDDPQGRHWAVVAIVNHDIGAGARPILDALIDDFTRHGPQREARVDEAP